MSINTVPLQIRFFEIVHAFCLGRRQGRQWWKWQGAVVLVSDDGDERAYFNGALWARLSHSNCYSSCRRSAPLCGTDLERTMVLREGGVSKAHITGIKNKRWNDLKSIWRSHRHMGRTSIILMQWSDQKPEPSQNFFILVSSTQK